MARWRRSMFVVLLLGMGGAVYLLGCSGGWAAQPLTLCLEATPPSLAATEQEVEIALKVEAEATQGMNAVEAFITYDASLFDFLSVTVDSERLPLSLSNESGSGWVHLASGASLGTTVQGPFVFARLRFKAKRNTEGGMFEIDLSENKTLVTLWGENILQAVRGVRVSVGPVAPTAAVTPLPLPVTPGPVPTGGPLPTDRPIPTGSAVVTPSLIPSPSDPSGSSEIGRAHV